jgi:hypothetical protein
MKLMKFRKDMAQQVIAGHKTQTRRLLDLYSINQVLAVYTIEKGVVAYIKITCKRYERIQSISDLDVGAEGFASREDFMRVWNDCYPDFDWNVNPEVVVYEFRLEPCIEERTKT